MTGSPNPEMPNLLGRLSLSAEERRAFHRTDSDGILESVRVLTAAAVFFNAAAIDDFGGRLGSTRGMELVEQVIGAAFQSFGGEDPHPGAFGKAAMLLRGITAGHPFQDGNKRTGFLVASYYLDAMGHPITREFPFDQALVLSRRVSAGDIRDVSMIAVMLEAFWAG